MGAVPSRTSLLRLLLGAAFMVFGFFLASTTAVRADDSGPLGTVDAVTTVEQVVDTTVDVVDSAPARSSAPVPVTDVVTASADLVEEVVAEPAKVVDESVRTVTETVAEPVVEPVAEPVVKAVVEPVAEPVVKAVVEPVVASVSEPVQAVTTTVRTTTAATTTLVTASVDTVTEAVEQVVAPVTTAVLPPVTDVIDPIVSPVDPVGTVIHPVTDAVPVSDVPAPFGEVRDEAATLAAARSFAKPGQLRSVVRTADSAPSALARDGRSPWTLSQRNLTLGGAWPVVVSGATDRAPSTPAPRPAGPQPGAVPGSGSSGASSPGGTDVATTTSALSLPESSSAAPTSSTSRFTPGPAMDPGSRPD